MLQNYILSLIIWCYLMIERVSKLGDKTKGDVMVQTSVLVVTLEDHFGTHRDNIGMEGFASEQVRLT